MKVTLSIDGKEKQVSVTGKKTLRHLLEKEGVNEETGLIKLNGKLCHPLQELKNGDKLEFVNIIYGG